MGDAVAAVAISIESEQALLGSVIVNNQAYFVVQATVREEHFYEHTHRVIWRVIAKRLDEHGAAPVALIVSDLGADGALQIGDINLKKYVARLAAEAGSPIMAPDYAATLADLWRLRQLQGLGQGLIEQATAGADRPSVADILKDTDQRLLDIAYGQAISTVRSVSTAAVAAIDATADAYRGGRPPGYSFGLPTLDDICGRMMAGDLVVLLAPSHHGKTALATQILRSVSLPSLDATQGVPSLFIEMEMKATDIVRRMLAKDSGVSVRKQESGDLNDMEWAELVAAAREFGRLPIEIDESGSQTVSRVIAKIRVMSKLKGVRFVATDHVKLFTSDNPRDSNIEIIGSAAQRIKAIGMETGTVNLLLAQPTRESRKREGGGRPRVEDIYGGGVLEEMADIIVGLHNPVETLKQREPEPGTKEYSDWQAQMTRWHGKVEMAALKRRRGEQSGWRQFAYDGPTTTFSELQP